MVPFQKPSLCAPPARCPGIWKRAVGRQIVVPQSSGLKNAGVVIGEEAVVSSEIVENKSGQPIGEARDVVAHDRRNAGDQAIIYGEREIRVDFKVASEFGKNARAGSWAPDR